MNPKENITDLTYNKNHNFNIKICNTDIPEGRVELMPALDAS